MSMFHLKYPKDPNLSPAGAYDPLYIPDRGFGKVIFIPRIVNDNAAFTALNNLTEVVGDVSSLSEALAAAKKLAGAAVEGLSGLSGPQTKAAFMSSLQYVIYTYGQSKTVDNNDESAKLEGSFSTKTTEMDVRKEKITNTVVEGKAQDAKTTTTTSELSYNKVTTKTYNRYVVTKTKTVYGGHDSPLIISMPLKPEMLSDIQHSFSWNLEATSPGKQMQLIVDGVRKFVAGDIKGAAGSGAKAIVEKYGREGIMNALQSGPLKIGNVGGAVYTPKRQMFQETDIMSFTFDWDLIPRSLEEANEIIQIINAFRVLAYPWSVSGKSGDTNSRSTVRQPAIWQVKFPQTGDKFDDLISENNELLCIIKNVSMEIGRGVDGISKIPQFTDGFPNIIKLKVTMQEYWSVMDAKERFGSLVDRFAINKVNTSTNKNDLNSDFFNGEDTKPRTETETYTVDRQSGESTTEVKNPETVLSSKTTTPTSYNKKPSAATGSDTTGADTTSVTESPVSPLSEAAANARRIADEAIEKKFGGSR